MAVQSYRVRRLAIACSVIFLVVGSVGTARSQTSAPRVAVTVCRGTPATASEYLVAIDHHPPEGGPSAPVALFYQGTARLNTFADPRVALDRACIDRAIT